MTAKQVELYIARFIGTGQNMIVPNVRWGIGIAHECDILYATGSSYAHEIEIKVSRSDLLVDKKKRKFDNTLSIGYNKPASIIRSLSYAIPAALENSIPDIISTAGVIIVDEHGRCKRIRKAKTYTNARKLTGTELACLGRLSNMRMWNLKEKIEKQNQHPLSK